MRLKLRQKRAAAFPKSPLPTWCVRPVCGLQRIRLSPPPATAAASAVLEQGAAAPAAASAAPGAEASTVNSVSAGLPPAITLRATLQSGKQANRQPLSLSVPAQELHSCNTGCRYQAASRLR